MMEHTPQMTAQSGLAFAVAVVDVGKGEKILSLFREEHALLDYVCMAHGTARTEMLDLLGIGETAKAVVFCLAASGQAQRILNRLGKELQMRYPGRGIAFTIPVSGIGRRWHSLLTQADEQEEIRMNKSEQTGFDVVAVVMERGAQGRRTRRHGDLGPRHRGKRGQALFRHRDTGGKGNCFPCC